MRVLFCIGVLACLALAPLGCENKPQKRDIQVNPSNDPLAPARTVLERYAGGAEIASEVSGFPKLIEDLKKADAERGAIVEQALEDIQKAPGKRAAIAKAALEKIKPSMK